MPGILTALVLCTPSLSFGSSDGGFQHMLATRRLEQENQRLLRMQQQQMQETRRLEQQNGVLLEMQQQHMKEMRRVEQERLNIERESLHLQHEAAKVDARRAVLIELQIQAAEEAAWRNHLAAERLRTRKQHEINLLSALFNVLNAPEEVKEGPYAQLAGTGDSARTKAQRAFEAALVAASETPEAIANFYCFTESLMEAARLKSTRDAPGSSAARGAEDREEKPSTVRFSSQRVGSGEGDAGERKEHSGNRLNHDGGNSRLVREYTGSILVQVPQEEEEEEDVDTEMDTGGDDKEMPASSVSRQSLKKGYTGTRTRR